MKKYIDIFSKLTRIVELNEMREWFSFYDDSVIMVSSRAQVFKIFK